MATLDDAAGLAQRDPAAFEALLQSAARELDAMRSGELPVVPPMVRREAARPADALPALLRDHLLTLRSLLRDVAQPAASERLRAIAATCQRLAWEPEFGFLFDRKRRLLHIGLRADTDSQVRGPRERPKVTRRLRVQTDDDFAAFATPIKIRRFAVAHGDHLAGAGAVVGLELSAGEPTSSI